MIALEKNAFVLSNRFVPAKTRGGTFYAIKQEGEFRGLLLADVEEKSGINRKELHARITMKTPAQLSYCFIATLRR